MPPSRACAQDGLSSSEVTRAICLVPSAYFSQAPWYSLPVHLCRFGVRSDGGLFPGTSKRPTQSDKGRQPSRSVTSSWPRNINLVPIDYAFRPRLRGRLTLLRLALSRNPWTFGDRVSHPVCRYSCQHSRFRSLHRMPYGPASQKASRLQSALRHEGDMRLYHGTLRYHAHRCASRASAHGLSPVTSSPQDSLSRPVSCYAFFK